MALSNKEQAVLMRRQIANEINDPNSSFSYGQGDRVRLNPNDDLLRDIAGYNSDSLSIYFDLLTDEAVYAPWAKQVSEVLSRPWHVEPGDESEEAKMAAEFVQATLDNLGIFTADEENKIALLESDSDLDMLITWMATADICGLAPAEVVWGKTKQGLITAERILIVNPTRILFEQDKQGLIYPKLRVLFSSGNGIYIPSRKFIFHRFWAVPTANPYGAGLGRQLYWPVKWKRDALSYWMAIIDRHADPAVMGTHPLGLDDAGQNKFINQLRQLAANGTMVMPEGYDVSKLDSGSTGVEWLQSLIEYSDKQAAMMILGEATSGEPLGGSQAREEINNSIRIKRAKELSKRINNTLNRTLIQWLSNMNFPGVAPPKIVRPFHDEADILDKAERLDFLGIRVDRDFLERSLGVPLMKKKKKPQ